MGFCGPRGISSFVITNIFYVEAKITHSNQPYRQIIHNTMQDLNSKRKDFRRTQQVSRQLHLVLEYCFLYIYSFLFHFVLTAGAYYPAQPQYPTSVQPAPVMINPAQQQQQAPPPQQQPTQSQGPPKRERKPVVCRNKRAACLLSEVKKMSGQLLIQFS